MKPAADMQNRLIVRLKTARAKVIGLELFLIAVLISGCAGVSVQRDSVGKGPEGSLASFFHGLLFFSQPKGIRYYQPANFVLVTVAPDNTIVTQHLILPDLERKLSAQPVAFLSQIGPVGESGGEITFKDGMMVSTSFKSDATAIPQAVIKTAETLASAVVKAAGPAAFDVPDEEKAARVLLFRLRFNQTFGHYELVGQNGFAIFIAVPKQAVSSQ